MKVPDIDEETLKKLPEWHGILREIYTGVDIEQNKSRSSRVIGNQSK